METGEGFTQGVRHLLQGQSVLEIDRKKGYRHTPSETPQKLYGQGISAPLPETARVCRTSVKVCQEPETLRFGLILGTAARKAGKGSLSYRQRQLYLFLSYGCHLVCPQSPPHWRPPTQGNPARVSPKCCYSVFTEPPFKLATSPSCPKAL